MIVIPFILLVIAVGALVVGYLTAPSESIKMMFLWLVVVVVLLGGGIMILMEFGRANKLRRRLKAMDKVLLEESLEIIKEKYLEIYGLYLKVSEKEKQNFYGRVAKVREKIEEQLQAKKKVEELLKKASIGSVSQRKASYDQLNTYYNSLSAPERETYYAQLMQVKEQLEKGM